MKKLYTLAGVFAYGMLNYLNAQIPTALDSSDFPKSGDSVVVHTFHIPPTEIYKDTTSANDSLTIERAMEKGLQGKGDFDMAGIANAGPDQTWNIHLYYYTDDPKPKVVLKKYLKSNSKVPGANSFPNANLYYTFDGVSQGTPYTSYNYFKKDDMGFYELGSYVTTSPALTLKNNVPKPDVKFPLDYNKPNNVVNQNIKTSGSLPVTSWYNVTVDAYGTVHLDTGTVGGSGNRTYTKCIRTVTEEKDTFDLKGLGLNNKMFVHSMLYSYYAPGIFEPVVTYSFAKIRNDMDPKLWKNYPDLAWHDEFELTYIDFDFKSVDIGIEENKENSSISVSPNPSNGKFNVNFMSPNNSVELLRVEVYDMLGQLIYSDINSNFSNGIKVIDLSSENKGIYLMRLTMGNEVVTKKIIIN